MWMWIWIVDGERLGGGIYKGIIGRGWARTRRWDSVQYVLRRG